MIASTIALGCKARAKRSLIYSRYTGRESKIYKSQKGKGYMCFIDSSKKSKE
jgi:hypothetical protein